MKAHVEVEYFLNSWRMETFYIGCTER